MTSNDINHRESPIRDVCQDPQLGTWYLAGRGLAAGWRLHFWKKMTAPPCISFKMQGHAATAFKDARWRCHFFQNMHRAPPSQGIRPGARRAPIMTFEPSCAFSRASTAGRPGSPSSAGPSPCPGRSAARTSMREANSGWGAPRERRFLLISLLISWSLTGAAVGH